MNENSGTKKRGVLFGVILPAALLGAGVGVGGWTIASNWNAEAATRAPAAKARPAAGATKYDRVLGNIYYKVPQGYRAVQSKGGVYMVRASEVEAGNITGGLLMTPGLPFNADLRQKMQSIGKKGFVQAMALLLTGQADDAENTKLSDPESLNDGAKDGYENYSVIVISKDKDSGKTRYVQLIVTLTGGRIEGVMRLAYDDVTHLEPFTAGLQALGDSMEFKTAGAPPLTRLAAALPTDLATLQAKPKATAPAQSASKGGSAPSGPGVTCKTEQRSRIFFNSYNPFGGGGGSTIYYVPVSVCRKGGKIVSQDGKAVEQ